MTTDRVTSDDLQWAATWLMAYEGASGVPAAAQSPDDDDEQQAVARRVAAWIETEVTRRTRESNRRVLAKRVAERTGLSPQDPDVQAAVRNTIR